VLFFRREASFGHAILQLINATTATFTWHRNQDGAMVVGDFATIVRDTIACPCASNAPVLSHAVPGESVNEYLLLWLDKLPPSVF
jgi:hypothetical protein